MVWDKAKTKNKKKEKRVRQGKGTNIFTSDIRNQKKRKIS